MANRFAQYGMRAFARGEVVWKAAGGSNIRTALIDEADDTLNAATDDFLDDITAAAFEERSANMTLIDAAVDGVVDANDVTLVGTAGDPCGGILVYKFVTVDADSVPLFYWDTAPGLPVTLGGDVTIQWNASGLATI